MDQEQKIDLPVGSLSAHPDLSALKRDMEQMAKNSALHENSDIVHISSTSNGQQQTSLQQNRYATSQQQQQQQQGLDAESKRAKRADNRTCFERVCF